MLPHTRRGQDSVLLGDGLADEAVLLLGDPLDLGQDVFWYDVAFCQRLQGHVDRTCEQAQHPVLGRFRDSSMERDVRDYGDALLELVHLHGRKLTHVQQQRYGVLQILCYARPVYSSDECPPSRTRRTPQNVL